MRRLIPILCALALPTLAGCRGQTEEADTQDDDVRSSQLDLEKYSYAGSVVAMGKEAASLTQALRDNGAVEIDEGRLLLAGITARELEGGQHDPAANAESAYGLMCETTGMDTDACSVTAVVRTGDIETTDVRGTPVISKITVTSKLARKIVGLLPRVSPPGLVGSTKTAYAPLGIACETLSGVDQNGQIASCAIPTTGFGAHFNFKEAVARGDLKKADATKLIREFFPKG